MNRELFRLTFDVGQGALSPPPDNAQYPPRLGAEMTRAHEKRRLPRLHRGDTGTLIRGAPEDPVIEIAGPDRPVGVVIMPVITPLTGSPEGLRRVAAGLQDRGFATFLAELLSPAETAHGYHNFDFEMLAGRITEVTDELIRKAPFEDLPIGYFGTGIDAAAMVIAAARPDNRSGALVLCNARPELASAELPRLRAPTLFIVEDDELALGLNRTALAKLNCPSDLAVLRWAGRDLTSPGVASEVAQLTENWFATHLCGKQTASWRV